MLGSTLNLSQMKKRIIFYACVMSISVMCVSFAQDALPEQTVKERKQSIIERIKKRQHHRSAYGIDTMPKVNTLYAIRRKQYLKGEDVVLSTNDDAVLGEPTIVLSWEKEGRRVGKKVMALRYDASGGSVQYKRLFKKPVLSSRYNTFGYTFYGAGERIRYTLITDKGDYDYEYSGGENGWQYCMLPFAVFTESVESEQLVIKGMAITIIGRHQKDARGVLYMKDMMAYSLHARDVEQCRHDAEEKRFREKENIITQIYQKRVSY